MIERHWDADVIATMLGIVFLAVGVLGFIPNPIVSDGGYFHVNAAHNFAHLATGAILVASRFYGAPVTTIRVIAIVYTVLAVLGFIAPDAASLGGLVAMNHADHWLHAALAVVLLFIGFARPLERTVTTAHM